MNRFLIYYLLATFSMPLFSELNAQDYEKEWKIIDSLSNLRLPESALKEAEALVIKIRKDINNKNQTALFVKSMIYLNKFQSQLEENGLAKAIYRFQIEMEKEKGVNKAVMQSMLAQMYQQYLANNIYKFKDRTTIIDYNSEDIATWDIRTLTEKIFELYTASIQDKEIRLLKLTNYKDLLSSSDFDPEIQPTLYDLLMKRAIDFFSSDNAYLAQPAYRFFIEEEVSLADANTFINYKFAAKDSLSGKFRCLLLYQELLRFHKDDRDPAALADVDFRRLRWVHSQAIFGDKDVRYLSTLDAISKKYSSSPIAAEALWMTASWYYSEGSKYQPSPEQTYRWDLKTAVEICNQIIAKYPEKCYGAQMAKSTLSSIKSKSFNFQMTEVSPSNKPMMLSLSYKNLSSVHIKIIKITESDLDKIYRNNYDKDKALEYINKLNPIKTWSSTLPNEGDYQNHRLELSIPGQGYGMYLIVLSEKEGFPFLENGIQYATVNVSDLAYFNRKKDGIYEFFITDRQSGAPQKGVKAEFYISKYNSLTRVYEDRKVGDAVSDEKGYVNSAFSGTISTSFYVRLTKGDDVLFKKSSFYNYKSTEDKLITQTTHFFLDRAIYRPGQTVYYKGIVILNENDKKEIVPNYETEVIFYDANYQEVSRQKVKTNEYGSFQGFFTAPSGGLLGQMRIADNRSGSSKYFRVEEYKRPKFEVCFNPMDESFRINDKVKVKGNAKAYAGSAIDGAKVQYRVVRKVEFPYWRWYWGWNPYTRADQEIVFGESKTDEKGDFVIEFSAIPDKSIPAEQKPAFNYTVYADITDITGETRSKQSYVRVGYIALDANISVDNNIEKESVKYFEIITKNLNGTFERAKGKIKIEKLETPRIAYLTRQWGIPDYFTMKNEDFKKDFPDFAIKDEDKNYNWPVVKTVLETDFDSKVSDKLMLNFSGWEQGSYKITMLTADKFGEKIEVVKYFNLYSRVADKTPVNDILFSADNSFTAEPGEKITIDFGSFDPEAYILYEVEHENKLVSSEWIRPNGRKKFEITVEEKHRGNFGFHLTMVHKGRFNCQSGNVYVPWTNKQLAIEYSTFRDKLLPGQEEEWRVKISGVKKDKVAAEFLTAMYDASLDAFAANSWGLSLYSNYFSSLGPMGNVAFSSVSSQSLRTENWNIPFYSSAAHRYTDLNWFGISFYDWGYYGSGGRRSYYAETDLAEYAITRSAAPKKNATKEKKSLESPNPAPKAESEKDEPAKPEEPTADEDGGEDMGDVKVRSNLNETVFFFPQMMTDENGDVIIKFTMNEALTKWKFMWLAHTKDLKVGSGTKDVVTQKDLMVMPNAPRFLRQNDEIYFTAKVSNMTDKEMKGEAVLQLFDAISMKAIDADFANVATRLSFSAAGGQSAPLVWKLKVPDMWNNAVTYRVIAKAGNFSDGEESSLPVVSNRMLVTETMPLPIRGGQTKTYEFNRMAEVSKSTTMRHHKYTLEFTPNPAWYALQALPYIMEYPYECTEQIFSRFYANSIASNVANSHPKIKKVFDTWKDIQPEALKSNLSKNQELKYALLEETPWVLAAQSEEQQKRDLGVLFDLNRMSNELAQARDKMADRQLANGGFAWFPGDRDDWHITQYIVEGLGHLDQLGVKVIKTDKKISQMMERAVKYTDDRLAEHYEDILKEAKRSTLGEKEYLALDHLGYMAIHFMYARSFYADIPVTNNQTKKAIEYFEGQAAKYCLSKSDYMQGLIALSVHRKGIDKETAQKIVKSLKERALKNEEMGMYWQYPHGYYWYEMPIETHCLLIEVFNEVAQDAQAVDDLKTYLLKNKQTTHWKTTKATASACYVLLKTGDNWLMEDQEVKITLGNEVLDQSKITKEAGTGYFKTSWDAAQIKPEMATVKVENPNKNVAWGAVYWQYFEQLDKITHFKETPLKLNKKLYKEVRTDRGPVLELITEKTKLTPGDLIKVRVELKVDRDMEYVHMKDMRASGFEPVNVLSQYKYQGGLGYYESTKDASTNYFFSRLTKGTYVFEYPLRVNHKGDFSNGVTTIQCMYAPEFTSHSEGVRVKVE